MKYVFVLLILTLPLLGVGESDNKLSDHKDLILIDCFGTEHRADKLLESACIFTGLYTKCKIKSKCPAVASFITSTDQLLVKSKIEYNIIVFSFDSSDTIEEMKAYHVQQKWSNDVYFVKVKDNIPKYNLLLKTLGFRISLSNEGEVYLHGKQAFLFTNNRSSVLFDRDLIKPDEAFHSFVNSKDNR